MWPIELEVPRFGAFARQLFGISSADLKQALDLQSRQGGRLGTILVRAGLLTSSQVLDVLRRQARWAADIRSRDLPAGEFPLATPVSICMPCYNEAQVLDEVITGAMAMLPEFLEEFELVIVDDGSSDQTAAIVESYAADDDRIRLVRHEKNRGYGATVATGLRAARGELIFFTDGDGQFNLLDLPQLLVETQRNDVVVGYRYDRADHTMRKFNALGWKMVIRGLIGLKIRDLDCAFKIFPRRVLDRLQFDSEGACISAEIMAQCQGGGVSIGEVPVNHYPRSEGKATGANLKVIAKAFRELPVVWKYRQMKPWTWDTPTPSPTPQALAHPVSASDSDTALAASSSLPAGGPIESATPVNAPS